MQRILIAGLASVATFLAGCGGEDSSSSSPQSPAGPRSVTAVEHAAPLARALPIEAVAYLRTPSLADWLFEPSNAGLNEARVLDANREAAAAILDGLRTNVFGLFEFPQAAMGSFMSTSIRAPIEVVAMQPEGSPIPEVLIRTKLHEVAADAVVDQLVAMSGGALSVTTPIDDDGYMALAATGLPVLGHYDGAELHLLGGLSVTQERLATFVAGSHEQSSALADFENTVDATGRQSAVWVDVDRLWPMVAATQSAEETARLEQAGFDQIDFVWLGNAARNGRAQTILHVAMPQVGFRTMLPAPSASGAVEVAGAVDLAARLSIPDRAAVEAAIEWIISLDPQELQPAFDEGMAMATEALGRNPLDFLGIYGPDVNLVSDAAGSWASYRIADQGRHEEFEQWVGGLDWLTLADRSMAGLALKEVRLVDNPFMDDEMRQELPPGMIELLSRFSAPSFYHQASDNLISANVPQILVDREARSRRPLADWLGQMDLNWDHAIVALATEVEHSPRDVYHVYLNLLGLLSNLTKADVDLTRFPTAGQLGMPGSGRLGFQLDSTASALSLRFSYETSGLEVLLNADLLTIYAIGVMAAIAIPAYQEYMERSMGMGMGDVECPFTNDGECDEPDICPVGTDVADCANAGGPDSCSFANDGECDEPDLCAVGTDTTDCGSAGATAGPDSCTFANDGECDEPDICAAGTDTTDCSAPVGPDSCTFANDGACDEPDICREGTDTTDCANAGGPDSCAFANDGECDEPDVCDVGTDTTDCAAETGGGSLSK